MESAFYNRLSNLLWGSIASLVVVLAIYVSFGRLLMPMVGDNQDRILAQLNARTPFTIATAGLTAQWRGFSPELIFADLRLQFPDSEGLLLRQGSVTVDIWRSLASRSLRLRSLRLQGLTLAGEVTADGRFLLQGFGQRGGDTRAWLEALLLDIEQVTLVDNTLEVELPTGTREPLELDLTLLRDGSRRQLRAQLEATAGTQVTVLADGLGNPFVADDYSGEVYARAALADLAQLPRWQSLLGPALPVQASGAAEVEAWLSWSKGISGLQMRFTGEQLRLQVEGGSLELPVDALAVDASLQQRGQRWTLFTGELALQSGGVDLQLPRVQLDLWGDSLRLRSAGVPLADVSELIVHSGSLPPALVDVITELAPAGMLGALELRLEDVGAPAGSWAVNTQFSELALAPWRGVPGVEGASGYVQLAPGAGSIVVDSQQLALDFPLLYRRQLSYQDIYGDLDFAWDNDGLRLHSGLLTAVGAEGTLRALLGLNIPFHPTDTGIEMDLLVGLGDADISYRNRYLPYRLNPGLLAWLETSLGEGTVNTGAFLWRGSLRPGATAQRTVQLFFDVSDIELLYDPRWPPVSGMAGTVLVDDVDISVWASRARLYDAQLEQLSAEVWRDPAGVLRLAVAAGLNGSASDGLRLLRESPIGLPLGSALADWRAEGEMQAEFALELVLAQAAPPPVVGFRASLMDTALSISPGNLNLEAVNATVNYDSATGFRAENLSARLWGQPLALALRQLEPTETVQPGGLAPVELAFAGTVRATALGDWLRWPVPTELASGATDVSGSLTLASTGPPRLQLQSNLQGVRLALPETWGKTAAETLPLRVQTTLGETPLRLDIVAGRRWQLMLDIGGGHLQGAVLALQQGRPLAPIPGQLRVNGHAALIDVSAWQNLLAELPAASGGIPLQLSIEDLQIDSLRVWGQHLTDVILNLRQSPEQWQLGIETGWLQGQGVFDTEFTRGELDVSFLELDGLLGGGGKTAKLELEALLDLPRVAVSIAELSRAGQRLGSLDFVLAPETGSLRAQVITGELFGLEMSQEAPASLAWSRDGTSLQAGLVFEDLGDTLTALGYERILETEAGALQLDVQWPGAPGQFSLGSSAGSLRVDIGEGRFLTASAGASGTLRVVSILNLAEIVQRLSLTQLFESGIPFTSVNGEAYLHGGEIEVPRLDVGGAATGFRFTAVSTVAERSLNGELVATLPVANNLAWVAALTAGLPVAAGVFVVSKLFEKQVTQLSSAVYRIDGTWDEPRIQFDRVFDSAGRSTPVAPLADTPAPVQSPLVPAPPVSVIPPVADAEAASSSSRK